MGRIVLAAGMVLLSVVAPTISYSLLLPLTLDEMIAKSDMIIIGLISNERTSETKLISYHDKDNGVDLQVLYSVAEVKALRCLKGNVGRPGIMKVLYAPSLFEDVVLKRGEKAIFFLRKHKAGYMVAQGVNGKVEVMNDMVRIPGIRGEARAQGYDQFIRKIEDQVNRTTP
jgi:hypothetical protein